jgi:F-type H+-transporting ATPase subunit b
LRDADRREQGMNIAITLVIQGFVFFFVAWLVMKYIWPFLLVKIETRQKVIAEGLAAAAKSEKDLNEAEARSKEIIREARERAAQIVDQASKRSNEMIEEAKGTASSEAQRLIAGAREEVSLETTRARESLRREVGELAVAGASRLLGREIDPRTHADLLDKLSAEVARG